VIIHGLQLITATSLISSVLNQLELKITVSPGSYLWHSRPVWAWQPTSHPQIFSDATTTLWGCPGSIINLLSYVLRVFWQKLRTVQKWKGSFCWEGCLNISPPKTRKCHCAAQMDNSAHNTSKYPSSLVLRTCPEVPISWHTRNSICNVPKSWGSEGGYQYPSSSSHSGQG